MNTSSVSTTSAVVRHYNQQNNSKQMFKAKRPQPLTISSCLIVKARQLSAKSRQLQ